MIPNAARQPPVVHGFEDLTYRGSGPNGEVWAATERTFGRPVALKVLHVSSEAAIDRAVRAAGQLDGVAGIVRPYRTTRAEDGRGVLVMPLLTASLEVGDQRGRPRTAADLARWRQQTTAALDTAHRSGLQHGGIRPANILVSSGGDALIDGWGMNSGPVLADPDGLPADSRRTDVDALADAFRLVEEAVANDVTESAQGDGLASSATSSLKRRELTMVASLIGVVLVGAVVWLIAVGVDTPRADRQRAESTATTSEPERPLLDQPATSVSVGSSQACSLTASGKGVCWGQNVDLGAPTTLPADPDDLPGWDPLPFVMDTPQLRSIQISSNWTGGDNVCGVTVSGAVLCRGWSITSTQSLPDDGGVEQLNRSDLLYEVPGIDEVRSVAVGADHACALSKQSVECWGNNSVGQLGDSTTISSDTPVTVTGLTDATAITANGQMTCAIRADSTVWCWGLARPPVGIYPSPVLVEGLPPVTQVSAGGAYACGIASEGALWCWGDFDSLFGQRDTELYSPPTRLESPEPVVAVSSGRFQFSLCAVGESGSVWCWELGSTDARRIAGIDNAIQVAHQDAVSCALMRDGAVSCWGAAVSDGEALDELVPVQGLGP